ncbi:MAG: CDP-alcohol phosphatidyltransferase family protein [Planctomycetaceae bacterium]
MPDHPAPHCEPPSDHDNAAASSTPGRELNYFAAGEQSLQAGFRNQRDRWLAPLVQVCQRLGISADLMSVLAMSMLLPFGLAIFHRLTIWAPAVAVTSLALHVLLDGLDGPLARAAGTDGPAGAFTDMCLDHSGYLIVTTLLTASGLIDGAAACAYVSAYTLAIVMIVLLNILHRPLAYVVRTKYVFYALVGLQQLAGINLLTEASWTFATVHTLFAAVGFVAVRRALR